MSLTTDMFIGAWFLKSWRIEYEDRKITYPFGDDAVGQIVYSVDKQMSATISTAKRLQHETGNTRNWVDADKAEAFGSYFHYAGGWHIDEDHVVHTVSLSLNPNFVGSEQRRYAEFYSLGKLRLSAKESLRSGGTRHHILEWQR